MTLMRHGGARRALALAGIVPASVAVIKAGHGAQTQRLEALRVLERAASSPGYQHAELMAHGGMDALVGVAAGDGEMGGDSDADAQLLVSITKEKAMDVVRHLIRYSNAAAEEAVSKGLAAVIRGLLPVAPSELSARYGRSLERGRPGDTQRSDSPRKQATRTIFGALAPSPQDFTGPRPQDAGRTTPLGETPDDDQETPLEPPKFPLPSARAASPRIQTAALRALQALLKHSCHRTAVIGEERGEAPSWQHTLLHLLEDAPLEPASTPGAQEPEVPKTPEKGKGGKGAKGAPKGAPAKAADPKAPILEEGQQPPFPACVRSAALYCLYELAKDGDVAAELLEASGQLLSLLARLIDSAPDLPYPLDVRHPAALLASCLTNHIVSPSCAPPGPGDRLRESGLVQAFKRLASRIIDDGRSGGRLDVTGRQAARAALGVSGDLFRPPVHKPLPSPPPTPPPPLLPTTQYIWDALGRPVMTDGLTLRAL
eukprot:evm.model.scf_1990.3 EVM.evm.TU.scf_1990.3   scf_1990:7547-15101(-)